MTFNEAMSTACDIIANTMGETVTHTDSDGNETIIDDATFAENKPDTADARDGQESIHRAGCTFAKSDVASPALGDTIARALDSSEWAIETKPITVGGGDRWQTGLMRIESIEKTREGHRLPRR